MAKVCGALKAQGATKHRANPDSSLVLYRDRPGLPVNGVGRLPAAMTINGATEYPVFRYTAGGGLVDAADWRPWGYGENLDITGAGTDPTLGEGSPALGVLDDSVWFTSAGANVYAYSGGNSYADITTEDLVIEIVFKWAVTPNGARLVNKYSANTGWALNEGSDKIQFVLGANGGTTACPSAVLVNGAWYYGICFTDRSGYVQWYIDGVVSGAPTDITPRVLTTTSAVPLAIGGQHTNLTPYDSNIAYCALWKRAAWLDTHLQATIAEQRASLYWGWRPQQARGTAVPTVRTRASDAYLDKVEGSGRKLYYVGNNVPRCVSRLDKNGKLIKGYLPEVQITNLCLRSEEIDINGAGAPWTHTRCSVTNTSTTTLPNGQTSVNDVIHEDGTAASSHAVTQSFALSAGTKYVFSFFAKAINRDRVRLQMGGVAAQTWDLTNGVLVGGPIGFTETGIIGYRNGWYRCWGSYTATVALSFNIYPVSVGATFIFDGLDQDSIYCWGVQVEAGVDYPTSYMPTAAAAVIREEDVLRYKGDDGNLGGVGSNKRLGIKMKLLAPDFDLLTGATEIYITDGGGATNRVIIAHNTADDRPIAVTDSDGGSQGSCQSVVDIFDGAVHELDLQAKNDLLSFAVDGGAPVQDTDCDMPDDLDRIEIGVRNTAIAQANFPLADIEIYPREIRD